MGFFSKHFAFDNLISSIAKIKRDIKKVALIFDILVQVIFLIFYGYQVFKHLNALPYLIIYSILLVVSLAYFVIHCILISKQSKASKKIDKKVIKPIFKLIKVLLQLAGLVVSLIEAVTTTLPGLTIFFTAMSAVMLIINFLVYICVWYINKTIDRLIVSFKMDREKNTILKTLTKDNGPDAEDAPISEEEMKIRAEIEKNTDEFYSDNPTKMKERQKDKNKKKQKSK